MMILSEATLFPNGLLPLYVFEPRYRQMLARALETHRMFVVARQRPGQPTESPEAVAGLGVIRACVDHPDGTSRVMLQGMSRVRLELPIHQVPYPLARIQPIKSVGHNSTAEDALVAKVHELVGELIQSASSPAPQQTGSMEAAAATFLRDSRQELGACLASLDDAGQLADFVASTFLAESGQRQILLETENVEQRLRRLIQFLLAQVRQQREIQGDE